MPGSGSSTNSETLENCSLYLKSLYKVKSQESSYSEDQWPPPVTNKVFRLALVKVDKLRTQNVQEEFLRQKTIAGKVDNVLEEAVENIELKDILQDKKSDGKPKKVLLEGAPGCGKSTLSLQICHLWSKGELFQEYKLVILVRLRDQTVQDAKNIIDLLPCPNPTMAQDVDKLIGENNGNNVLFVLDGWDEIPQSAPGHALILSLINRTQLHESSIIITSRPTSSANLHPLISSRIEILGFTKDELRRYFSDCLKHTAVAVETLLKKISENPALEGSCYLPMNASVIVHLFKSEESLVHFSTQYSIFSALIRNLMVRHLRKNGLHKKIPSLKSLDELPELIHGPFRDLCELAYNGVVEDKVTFDVTFDSSFNTLGLLQGVESFAGCGISHSYNFLHLSIQELLAAFHIATRFKSSKQTSQFKKLLDQARFNAVFGFYAAKTKLQTPGINDVVMTIAGKCTIEDPKREDKAQLISLFRCLFEAQDPSLCQVVVEQRVKHILSYKNFFQYISGSLPDHISKLDLLGTTLNPMDCLALGYFLTSVRSDLDVNLLGCRIGDEGCRALFRAKGQVYHIKKLG
jgi:ATP-dependent RNA helicase DHX33